MYVVYLVRNVNGGGARATLMDITSDAKKAMTNTHIKARNGANVLHVRWSISF